jgi:hypothetical protein
LPVPVHGTLRIGCYNSWTNSQKHTYQIMKWLDKKIRMKKNTN